MRSSYIICEGPVSSQGSSERKEGDRGVRERGARMGGELKSDAGPQAREFRQSLEARRDKRPDSSS